MESIIITGGAGFIGSHFARLALSHTSGRIVVVDKLTYAGNLENLADIKHHDRFSFVEADISDENAMENLIQDEKPQALVNFAAESHVDRSIEDPKSFMQTNLMGVFVLLEESRTFWTNQSKSQKEKFRFLHISTDEVYGSLGPEGSFSENSPYAPNSPYSASKAGADHLVRSYGETYGLPIFITNCSNNFGPYQFPEKLIPLMILNALEARDLPIYGDGQNVRDWLYVEDHCDGILTVLEKGRIGEKYNIGAHQEKKNLDLITNLCDILEKKIPAHKNSKLSERKKSSYRELISFVPDRPGHDRRYAIDSTKIQKELSWKPKTPFNHALEKTVDWYLQNKEWCRKVQERGFDRERLGLDIKG